MSAGKIPPRGTSNLTEVMVPVPHGWEYRASIANLSRSGSPEIPNPIYPYVVLWTVISQRLTREGMDLQYALDQLEPGEPPDDRP